MINVYEEYKWEVPPDGPVSESQLTMLRTYSKNLGKPMPHPTSNQEAVILIVNMRLLLKQQFNAMNKRRMMMCKKKVTFQWFLNSVNKNGAGKANLSDPFK